MGKKLIFLLEVFFFFLWERKHNPSLHHCIILIKQSSYLSLSLFRFLLSASLSYHIFVSLASVIFYYFYLRHNIDALWCKSAVMTSLGRSQEQIKASTWGRIKVTWKPMYTSRCVKFGNPYVSAERCKTCTSCTHLGMSKRNAYNVWVYLKEGGGRWERVSFTLEEQNVKARLLPRKFLVGHEVSWEGLDPDIRRALRPPPDSPVPRRPQPLTTTSVFHEQQESANSLEESSLLETPENYSLLRRCADGLGVRMTFGLNTVDQNEAFGAPTQVTEQLDSFDDPEESGLQETAAASGLFKKCAQGLRVAVAVASSAVRAHTTQTPPSPAAAASEQAAGGSNQKLNPAADTLWSQCAKVLTVGTPFGLTAVFLLASVLALAYVLSKVHSLATYALHSLCFYERDQMDRGMDMMDQLDRIGRMWQKKKKKFISLLKKQS